MVRLNTLSIEVKHYKTNVMVHNIGHLVVSGGVGTKKNLHNLKMIKQKKKKKKKHI